MSKKSYMSLLKEAIAEFDTSDTLDVKGPMLDPIISWKGDGELPIYKDAASILERYYFDEKQDKQVETLDESDYENDSGSAGGAAMKSAHGTGTDQAGTSDSDTIDGAKKEREEEIAKEQEEIDDDGGEEEVEEMEFNNKDVPEAKEYTDESLEMENAIIEKLIAEMEDEEEDEEEEVKESEVMNYTGSGPKDEAPKEKEAKGPEEDAQGAGTQQAGTGDAEGQIPDRKDIADDLVKPKEYTDENARIDEALAQLERELLEQDEEEEEEDEELDVDKEMTKKEQAPAPSAVPGGPSPKKQGEDYEDDEEAYSEAFDLFKEQVEDDDEEEEEEEEE